MKNKKTIIICIFILIILGVVLINPIKKVIYAVEFKENVKKFLNENYKTIDSVTFEGEYNLDVNLNMNTEFNSLGFLEQKPIIRSISRDLEDLYISYRDKVNKIDSKINNTYGIIRFNIDDFYYNTSFVSNTIYKNGSTEYSDKDYFIEQINFKIEKVELNSIEKDYIEKYLNAIDNIETYKYLLDIEDNNTLLLEIAYQYLLNLSNNNKYTEDIFYYKNKLSDYKDSTALLNKIDEEEKNRKEIYYSVPRIGMTKNEVLQTTWSEPQSIDHGGTSVSKNNKKRTDGKWDESWYYRRNNRNIFIEFKDGKVTRIITSDGKTGSKEVSSGYGL